MVYVLLSLMIVILVSFLLHTLERKKSVKDVSDKTAISVMPTWENAQNEIIAEGAFYKIISKGLGKYLLSDFTIINKLLYEDLRIPENAYEKLSIILVDVLQYLKLPPLVQLQIVYISDNQDKTQTAGQYQSKSNKKTIVIKIKKEYSPVNVLAILCHECTHYFMEFNKLDFGDSKLNEIQTDIMAVMIGFGEILIEGYEEIVKEKKIDSGEILYASSKIGYITSSDCREVKNYLNYKRSLIIKEQDKLKQVKILDNKLKELCETAEFLNEQIKNFDFTDKHFTDQIKAEQVQAALYSYECKNVSAIILKIEGILASKKDMDNLKHGISIAEDLCSDLIKWLALFQNN